LASLKFVRQDPVGPYIVDLVCREAMQAIEIDGATHSTEAEVANDRRREAYLISQGLHVLRFTNDEVYRQLDSVLETIVSHIERRS
jgi:very-short-patch-repair endonuclease